MNPPPPPLPNNNIVTKKIVSESQTYTPLNPLPDKKVIPVHQFDWSSVSRLQVSGDGSSGVLFVHNKDGTAVLKATQSEGDLFANLLMQKCGILVPHTEVITRQSEQWNYIKRIKEDKEVRFSFMDISSRRRLDGMVKSQQFHLLELILGESLHCLEHPAEVLVDSVIYQLGEISAVDLIINNWDRIPSFWKNQGNSGNMIIANKKVYAIDQIVSPVLHDLESYFVNVGYFLREFLVFGDVIEEDKQFKFELGEDVSLLKNPKQRVRAFFLTASGVDIGDSGVYQFRKGFTDKCKFIAHNITTQDIKDLYNETWKHICQGFTEIGPEGMFDPKDVQFISKGIEKMKECLLREDNS
eukprot:TRINITY_DN3667_c0_g1_i1.p1 TRINITY_DN3667_c0_g1~~TRINITY_DN3667_c0_g1_i1.p1  ORF type:complete len:355 (-),score=66.84 TRINITY_DN3667_c0_g1_i1:16-1080(-)